MVKYMKSRMDRYYKDESSLTESRAEKNKNVYKNSDNSDIDVVEQQFSVINENATFMQGRRFDKDATEEEVREWIVRLGADIEFD